MSDSGWEWTCEDSQEMIGIQTILEGAGVEVAITRHDERYTVVAKSNCDRARELYEKMGEVYARREQKSERENLDRRNRYRQWSLVGVLGFVFLALFLSHSC